MLDRLLQFILHQKLLVILAAVVLLGAGVAAWTRLPIDAFPDVTNAQVMVITKVTGMAPGEIERLVTFPIEAEMGGLPNVRQVRSLSRSGLSQVVVIFEDQVDTYFARQVVFERLAQARDKLPAGIEPELGPISTGLGEIYQYVLESGYYCPKHPRLWEREAGTCPDCGTPLLKSEHDLMSLRTLQDWTVAPQLRRLQGINEMNSFGGFVKQFHVIAKPDQLLKYKISLKSVLEALEANNANAGGGFLVKGWEQFDVVSKGLVSSIEDLEHIVLEAEGGTPIYLKDVADIVVGHQTRLGVVTKDGRGETVAGMAIMLKGSNSKEVVDRVRTAIPDIQKTLPPGVRLTPFYDRTDLIQACIRTVSHAIAEGVILIVAILFLILWDLRAALVVALLLPLTAAATFLLMGWQGVTANLMSLGGLAIAIGMVVDGAIVITENVARHMREQASTSLSRLEIAFEAAREVARPVSFAFLIIVIVCLPLFALQSMEGRMFKPLALTVIFALVGSLGITLTVIPALAAMLVKRRPESEKGNPLVRAIQALYLPILRLSMWGRWVSVAFAAALITGTFSLLPRIGTEFVPPLDEGAIAINVVRLPTANVDGAAKATSELERRLLARFPEIETVVSKTGRPEIAEDPMGPDQSDVFVMLKPGQGRRTARSREEFIEGIREEFLAIPGAKAAFSQPIALRVNELISGIKSEVAIKIIGDDMATLRSIAETIAPILTCVRGAKDIKIEQTAGFSQIEIQMDRVKMARHKVNAADINLLVEAAIGGKVATKLFEGQKGFDIFVRFPEERRRDTAALERLLVPTPTGYNVPLAELAAIKEIEVPAQVSRDDTVRRLLVECNVRGRDIGSFIEEAKAKVADVEAKLPEGYRLAWGGQFENQQRAMARLKILVPIAILLVFLLLFTSLQSIRSAVLVMTNLTSAMVGGILSLYLLGINFSVSAAVGFIALFGADVGGALVLVSFIDQLRARGLGVREAVFEACRRRVRPVMMTSLTTLLGLVPMLFATGAGSEIQKPLVAVVFGGMTTSLALTLIILPVLYALVNGLGPETIDLKQEKGTIA